jgi:hypothetical protein
MVSAKFTGFNNVLNEAKNFYNRVLIANDDTAEYARKLILDRIATGRTTNDKKMYYRGKKRVGDYSPSWAKERSSLGNAPFTLNYTGKLYKAFTYRKTKSERRSLVFYIRNTNARSGFSHKQLVEHFQNRFKDNIFYPSDSEFNKIRRYWQKQAKK